MADMWRKPTELEESIEFADKCLEVGVITKEAHDQWVLKAYRKSVGLE